MLIAGGVEFAHVGAVDDVEVTVFAGADGEVPDFSGGIFLAGEQSSAGAEVGVGAAFGDSVVHFEIVGDGKSAGGGETEEGVAVVTLIGEAGGSKRGIEDPIAVEEEDVSGVIGGHAGAGVPDGALAAVRSDVEDSGLGESAGVVTHDPSGVGAEVAVAGPCQVDGVSNHEQAGALFILGGVEDDEASGTVVAGARILAGDIDGAVVKFGAGGGVESVQALVIGGPFLRHGDDVDDRIADLGTRDDGRGGDSDFGFDLRAVALVGRGLAGFERGDLPEIGAGVGVVGVDGIVFGGDDEKIMSDAGDVDVGDVERLGVDQAVGRDGEEFAEGGGVYVGEGENGFFVVEAGAGVVVVVGENVLGANREDAYDGENKCG